MLLRCDHKYIILPVNHHAKKRCLKFYEGSKMVYDLQIELDFDNPEVEFYLDIERLAGKELELIAEPQITLDIKKSDTKYPEGCSYTGQYRPEFHYSAQRGWLNDPNGLVYYRGQYHMFYQHNPVGCKWGNMHWGHAVSCDLIHWTEKDIALYPDEMGTMFSGSAIIDTKNVTGLKQNENDVILIYYTAAGNTDSELSRHQPFVQCLAYSIDGGDTFLKYSANPIIPFLEQGNRDPKIVFDPINEIYVMVLYLAENRFMLLSSVDLLNWEQLHEIALEEDAECPDLYPLSIDGDKNNIKWVFSGASDRYLIGSLDRAGFHPETKSTKLQYSKDSYAAQTWSDIPDEDGRCIRIAWNRFDIPSMPFNMAMNIPCEMSLRTYQGEVFLCAYPVRELTGLHSESILEQNIRVMRSKQYTRHLTNKLYDITIHLHSTMKCRFNISLFGVDIHGDLISGNLICLDNAAPLECFDNNLELRLLIDVSNVEIFINRGKAIMSIGHIQDYALNQLVVGVSEHEIMMSEISITELKSIWD